MTEKVYKSEQAQAAAGEFLREYGKQYFFVVSEAMSIGRIKCDMVPLGAAGKGNISFYLTTEQMLSLCLEIVGGVFKKKIDADTGSYPSAYSYRTGKDACLRLNIGGGKVGCRIQLQNAETKQSYVMAVSMDSMLVMARKYLIYSGYTTVSPNSFYADLINIFEKGRVDRAKFKIPEDALEVPIAEIEPEPTPEPESKSKPETKLKPQTKEDSVFEIELTKGQIKKEKNGFWSFSGNCNNEKVSLLFRKTDVEISDWFKSIEQAVKTKGFTMKCKGEKKNSFVLFEKELN